MPIKAGRPVVAGLMVLVASLLPALAQVRVGIALDHDDVLAFEQVMAIATIYNGANTPIVLGETDYNASLTVMLTQAVSNTEALPSDSHKTLRRPVVIMPGDSHRELIEISDLFDLREEGKYQVTVIVEHDELRYRSRSIIFTVVNGIEIDAVTHPVPGYRDLKLTYSLRYWRRRDTEHLFLSVRDNVRAVSYGVYDLGPLIRFKKPSFRYDLTGSLMVIHQSGRERYTRSKFSISGAGVVFREQDHFLPDGTLYPKNQPVGIMRDRPQTIR